LDCQKPIPESISEICSLFEAKRKLWSIKLEYEQSFRAIKEKKYCEVNIEETLAEIERMIQVITKSKVLLKDDADSCCEVVYSNLKYYRDVAICLNKLKQPY